jgi:hypothetical protein
MSLIPVRVIRSVGAFAPADGGRVDDVPKKVRCGKSIFGEACHAVAVAPAGVRNGGIFGHYIAQSYLFLPGMLKTFLQHFCLFQNIFTFTPIL